MPFSCASPSVLLRPASLASRRAAAAAAAARPTAARRTLHLSAPSRKSLDPSASSSSSKGRAEKAQQEMHDMGRIDALLNEIGRTSTNTAGIPMRSKAPWAGVHAHNPWSFTFDPTGAAQAGARADGDGAETPTPTPAVALPSAGADEAVDLTPRRMSDSYVEISLPLLSDPALLNQYISTSGGVRIGKIMENLDSLAGAISYKHVLPPGTTDFQAASDKAHVYLATASADRLDLFKPLTVQDLKLSGHVCFAGSSSMEVFIKMEGLREGGPNETLMLGRFTMVARDARTHGARKVNPLLVETPAEKDLFDIGRAHKARKQDFSRTSLSRQPPTTSEIANLHTYMLKHKGMSKSQEDDLVLMRETVTSQTILTHPSDRNLHGKVFGGYLMGKASELSYANAVLFSQSPMQFLALDEISFARPVPIGSVVRLTATVTKSSAAARQVHSQVSAEVVSVATGETQTTNDFHFTWLKPDGALDREVVPETYHEAMAWLEAQRRMSMGDEMRGLLQPE